MTDKPREKLNRGIDAPDHSQVVPPPQRATSETGVATPEAPVATEAVRHPGGAPPRTLDQLVDRSYRLSEQSLQALGKYETRGVLWDYLDTWIKVVLALVASVGAVSFIAEFDVIALWFALTTAILSALNAALDPGQRALRHQHAARGYRWPSTAATSVYEVAASMQRRLGYGTPLEKGSADEAQFEELVDCLFQSESDIAALEQDAPYVRRTSLFTADGAPRSWWTLHKLRRSMKLRHEYDDYYRAYVGPIPADVSRS